MSTTNVADLTVDELRNLIRDVVAATINELLADPDAGLVLRDDFESELQHSLDQRRSNRQETESIEDVARELGLEW
jgi:hypothetical protein